MYLWTQSLTLLRDKENAVYYLLGVYWEYARRRYFWFRDLSDYRVSYERLLLSQYAQETQHEKILRGLAVGIAFTMYGRLEEADPLVTSLCADKDPILRRSGMYTLAMAYCGTGNNQAIRKLLHVAVSVYPTRLYIS